MELIQLIALSFSALLALMGLVLVALQKLGVIQPLMTEFHLASGGTVTLAGALLGSAILSSYSIPLMILYIAVILAVYLVIQLIFRHR